jgi:hypothetical protein
MGPKTSHLLNDFCLAAQTLRVNYKAMVDWRQHTLPPMQPTVIWCPTLRLCFHSDDPRESDLGPSYLSAPLEITPSPSFLSILLMLPLAGVRLRKDKDLGLFRVRARPQAQFFPLRLIIHGALLVQDFDFFMVDTVDTDMFLHMKMMHLRQGTIFLRVTKYVLGFSDSGCPRLGWDTRYICSRHGCHLSVPLFEKTHVDDVYRGI